MPQYQGVWSLQQQMQALTSGQWATDPNFKNTTLLLQADNAANGSQNNTFLDSSTNAFTITRNGNTTQGTFSPFSATGWSGYFDGTSDYIQYTNSDFSVSTGDFTAEWWMFITSDKSQVGIMTASTNPNLTIGYGSGSANARQPYVEWGGSGAYIGTMSGYMNTWVHICVMRSSGTVYTFQNGVLLGSASKSAAVGSTANMVIGTNAGDSAAQSVPGYLSNVRFAKAAIYSTSGFTPATTAFTRTSQNATNVQFLTLQSNRFLDSDGINTPAASPLTITRNGDVSVQAFSPFAPQFQYTATGTGGSGYFDGTGDYLTGPTNNAAFDITASDFCVEMWYYRTSSGATQNLFSYRYSSGPTDNGWEWRVNNTNTMQFFYAGGSSITTTATVPVNTWTHLAVTRSGTTVRAFINGALDSSATFSSSSVGSATFRVGVNNANTEPVIGYISGARLVKGSAVYTAAFTPPTAPLTATTNTQLLLNFTNAGIYDGTMKNNLETVGNASVSTSVVKYGSGSMYFDGTGDYLQSSDTNLCVLGSSDWTIEFWLNPTANNATAGLVVKESASANGYNIYLSSSGKLSVALSSNGTSYDINVNGSTTLNTGTWYYCAIVRSGSGTNNVKVYVNGSQDAQATFSSSINNVGSLRIGSRDGASQYFYGYMDDLRITKGIARYTQNFIPPSVALPRQ